MGESGIGKKHRKQKKKARALRLGFLFSLWEEGVLVRKPRLELGTSRLSGVRSNQLSYSRTRRKE